MGRYQHDVDELAHMERLCRELANDSRLPIERAGLLEMAENYCAASFGTLEIYGRASAAGLRRASIAFR